MADPLPDAIANRIVVLGRIRSAVGLAGWVKVESYTDPPDNILKYRVWQLGSESGVDRHWRAMKWAQRRWSGTELQIQMEGVTERNGADLLRNMDIGVMRREMPPPAAGEYYRDDLLGLTVYSTSGDLLGQLDHFQDSPAHAYMVLRGVDRDGKACEHFVPLSKGRVSKADFVQRVMTVDWTLDWVE
jgi:16S rRNA processing protein RimM